jgi:type I restriction enzyme S subunit
MVMDHWTQTTLADVCEMVKGTTPILRASPGPYPLVTTGQDRRTADHFQFDGEVVCVPMISSTGHGHASLKRVHFQTGKFALANLLTGLIVRDQSALMPRFLALYLNYFKDQIIVPLMVGAANMSLTVTRLGTTQVRFPSIDGQKRIVETLGEAEELCCLRDQADRRTADLIPAIFHEMFGQAVGNTNEWPDATVSSLAENRLGSIRTGPFGSDLHHDEFTQTGVPALAIDNVVTNEFRWATQRCIPQKKFEEFSRFRVLPGDVLITIMGTVGRACVTPDDLPECMSTKHLCVVTVDRSKVVPRYLWASLLFDQEVRGQTMAVAHGAIMEGWNSTIIKGLKIRVPPLLLQHTFAERVCESRALESKQAESRRRLDDLYQSLLHRAFRGEV